MGLENSDHEADHDSSHGHRNHKVTAAIVPDIDGKNGRAALLDAMDAMEAVDVAKTL